MHKLRLEGNTIRPEPVRSPRLKDVAEKAKVSVTTASRVFSDPDKVRSNVAVAVRQAAEALRYVPNSAARALRSRRTHIVGAIIPTLNYSIYAKEVEAIQKRLRQAGYSLVITTSNYELGSELEQVRLLVERGAEGLVLVGDEHAPELYRLLAERRVPYVNTYVYKPDGGHACVGFDNREAGAKLASHLLDLGHRKIAMISGLSRHNDRARERIEGVRQALAEHGLSLPSEWLRERSYNIEAGRDAFRQLWAAHARPTGIVCGSDVLAFGALAECQARGVRVPGQLSIVGFDNLEFAPHLEPPLTTLEVPAEKMGEHAAEYLVRRLTGEDSVESIKIDASLILRGTTRPPCGVEGDA